MFVMKIGLLITNELSNFVKNKKKLNWRYVEVALSFKKASLHIIPVKKNCVYNPLKNKQYFVKLIENVLIQLSNNGHSVIYQSIHQYWTYTYHIPCSVISIFLFGYRQNDRTFKFYQWRCLACKFWHLNNPSLSCTSLKCFLQKVLNCDNQDVSDYELS